MRIRPIVLELSQNHRRCRLSSVEAGVYHPVNTVAGVKVGCFPELYAAFTANPPDQVITL